MKYKWLNKNNSDKLIIFFNGWGMDELIVSHLNCEDYDVVVLFDYNDLNLDTNFSEYQEKHVIAWSMGVMIATLFNFENVKTKTSVCGTPFTVHNEFGIPEKIYKLTYRTFSDKTIQKFMERMFIEKPYLDKFTDRDIESLKTELEKMAEYKPNKTYQYTKAIIPSDDLIIPTANQENYWKNKADILKIKSGHCPFEHFKSWSELIG